MLFAQRDQASAIGSFDQAMEANGVPVKVTLGKSGANKAATEAPIPVGNPDCGSESQKP